MNEQLQAELTKIITNINGGAESAWGFITEQTPDVVQQLLLWYGISSFMMFVVGLAVIFFGATYVWKLKKWGDKKSAVNS
ncbi:hypothetical protein KAR91_12020 [Candidatus Pacearchaeota archaeon]|nr:hypothetical protein [Candidatus Pacearchaeota archaeon]